MTPTQTFPYLISLQLQPYCQVKISMNEFNRVQMKGGPQPEKRVCIFMLVLLHFLVFWGFARHLNTFALHATCIVRATPNTTMNRLQVLFFKPLAIRLGIEPILPAIATRTHSTGTALL